MKMSETSETITGGVFGIFYTQYFSFSFFTGGVV